jgi:phage gpG-like protein
MNPPQFFRTLRRSIPQLKAEIARKVIAVEAARFHNDNFRRQGYADTGVKTWKPRKDQDTTRSLLVKTGRLRRAATAGRTRGNVVDFVMPIYGKVHNEGGRAGRGRGFRMPKRQFAGPSRVLKDRFKAKAQTLIKNRLNRI